MSQRYVRIAALAVALAAGIAGAASAAVLNYEAILSGSQEVPANGSPAAGSATVIIDTTANTLSYTLTFSGLSAAQTAAHIHGFSLPGVNSGVKHGLALGSPVVGVWNYAEGDEANILAGRTYFNVHTQAFPGGEIRGQIIESSGVPTETATWGKIKRLF